MQYTLPVLSALAALTCAQHFDESYEAYGLDARDGNYGIHARDFDATNELDVRDLFEDHEIEARDILENYLAARDELADLVIRAGGGGGAAEELRQGEKMEKEGHVAAGKAAVNNAIHKEEKASKKDAKQGKAKDKKAAEKKKKSQSMGSKANKGSSASKGGKSSKGGSASKGGKSSKAGSASKTKKARSLFEEDDF